MAASSSLSRIEFALGSAGQDANAGAATATSGGNGLKSSISGLMPAWMGGNSSNGTNGSSSSTSGKTLPPPAGGSTTSSVSAHALANSAAAGASAAAHKATAAANKAGHQAKEFFSLVSSKVTGREHVPAAAPIESTGGDIEAQEGSTLLASSADPGGPTSGLVAQFQNEFSALTTLSWRNRLIAFGMCATAGLVMLGLSFMFVSLVFMGSPAKFALSYALANLFLMGSSLFLVGPAKQMAQMFGEQRALVSSVYLGSLLLLFYVSWQWSSFFIVIPVLAIQLISLLAYIMSYIPFGQAAFARICRWTIGRQISFTGA